MVQPFFIFSDWAFFALRVALGVIMVVHGFPKIKNIKGTAEGFRGMGLKLAIFWGALAAVVEFFGGIALVLGFFVQIAAPIIALQFLVILVMVKKLKNFGEFEYDLLIFASALVLTTVGGGAYSLDGFFRFILF